LRIKAYSRSESTILGQSTRTGVGISYRKEFDTLQDLIDEAKTNRKRNKKDRYTNQRKKFTAKIKELNEEISLSKDKKEKERLGKKVARLEGKLKKATENLDALPQEG
jgi:chromosome segregation ATPase